MQESIRQSVMDIGRGFCAVIPKIIHQTWKDENIPHDMFKGEWVDSWKHLHPSWEYKFWTDADIKEFMETKFPDFMDRFNAYPKNIQRVDAFRYFVLYEYGGLYADLDFECLRKFDPIFDEYADSDVILGSMGNNENWMHSLPNALMISKPNVNFWLFVIDIMKQQSVTEEPEFNTGPALLKRAYNQYENKSEISVLDAEYFYSMSWKKARGQGGWREYVATLSLEERMKMYPNSYAITYWKHSW